MLSFVVLGRGTHAEGNAAADVVGTAAPFLVAMLGGWLVTRAWRQPASLRTGTVAYVVTLAGGMALRGIVFGEGTAISFIIVAALFLGFAMLGWRVVAAHASERTKATA